ncbi:MAG: IS30 family transposase [Anaerolineae bacterium]
MRTYKQLTRDQRYQIYALKRNGHSQREMADTIGVHKSTISRELRRNCGQRGYRPKQAHRKALGRRRQKVKRRIKGSTWHLVEEKLRKDWSPEQVSGWLAKNKDIAISHEWIYQYVLADKKAGGDLHKHLRCQKPYRKRYGQYDRRGKLPNRVSIEERPAIVNTRERLGDWETDTMIGKGHRGALVTLTERKSRLALISRVKRRRAEEVGQAILALLDSLSNFVHTITSDNGKEFAEHETIAETLEADFYFAHPYSSWERGANENMNGLIRQYFPKDTDFTIVSDVEVAKVMEKLNHRPRKSLDYQTPLEVFCDHSSVALTS